MTPREKRMTLIVLTVLGIALPVGTVAYKVMTDTQEYETCVKEEKEADEWWKKTTGSNPFPESVCERPFWVMFLGTAYGQYESEGLNELSESAMKLQCDVYAKEGMNASETETENMTYTEKLMQERFGSGSPMQEITELECLRYGLLGNE
jgi:hypothetical protein